jgi:hypothetical protein
VLSQGSVSRLRHSAFGFLVVGCTALGLVTVLEGGCSNNSATEPCAPLPPPPTQALLWFTCNGTDLTNVNVSGPCASQDASTSQGTVGQGVYVASASPGVCHVELTFGTGFAYATDVTFESMTRVNCGTTEPYVGPTQQVFDVDNPSSTCVPLIGASDAGGLPPADASDGGGYATMCPSFGSVGVCPVAPDASDCNRPTIGCGLDALPAGQTCSGPAQCSSLIYPCPNWQAYVGDELTDGYICSCVGNVWSCEDCSPGAAVCAEAGPDAPSSG